MTQCPKLRTQVQYTFNPGDKTTKYYSINAKTMNMKETQKRNRWAFLNFGKKEKKNCYTKLPRLT